MKITAIIQARTNSSRYPNKVFASLAGKPLIWHVINRLKASKKIDEIVIATTVNRSDDILKDWATSENVSYFRGEENDVLNRFYETAKRYESDIIVRITSDDPFKDPRIIDKVIGVLLDHDLDFAYNNYPPSFPEGLDTEVFSFHALDLANSNSKDMFEREHVTQYFYRNPMLFKQENICNDKDISRLRWTIDTVQDYRLVENVYKALFKENEIFLMEDILKYLQKHPEVSEINMDVKRSAMYQ